MHLRQILHSSSKFLTRYYIGNLTAVNGPRFLDGEINDQIPGWWINDPSGGVCSHTLNAQSKLVKVSRLIFIHWYGYDTLIFPWQGERRMRIMTCNAKQGQIVEMNHLRSSNCLVRARSRLGKKSALRGIAWQRRNRHTITRTTRGPGGWNGGWVTPKNDWDQHWHDVQK